MIWDKRLEIIYQEMASLVAVLQIQGILSQEESNCLLSILDIVVIKQGEHPLIHVLREWQASSLDQETEEIIKATLLNLDFEDEQSLVKDIDILKELIYGEL